MISKVIRYTAFLAASLYSRLRVIKSSALSNSKYVVCLGEKIGSVLFRGPGRIGIAKQCQLGVIYGPKFFSSSIEFITRCDEASISIDENTSINNDCCFVSLGAGISIGRDCLIGHSVEIYDSDFHNISPVLEERHATSVDSQSVVVSDNVFIGSNVIILKGVTIGRNSVIGAGSVVVKSVPENSIAAGNPARVIGTL